MESKTKGLPSGTVTFLFTDIEGSTRLLRDVGDTYSDILDLHNKLLREVWLRHRGVEVNTEGDAFFVAFANAVDALAATIDAQRAIATADWPHGRPVLVRMGVHTGYGRPIEDDYRALAVHQAARVVNAANGGQVFATDEVIEVVGEHSLAAFDIERLGRYRVQDFDAPVALYSISAPDLAGDARPARVRPADSHNLVRPQTSLVGRTAEQADLGELVRPGALITLLGPGGGGKTRLSIEVGFNTVDRWPDGVWFVDLAPLSTGEVVPTAIADAAHAPSVVGNDALSDLVAHLADRSQLLVLDNCEHLIEPVARIVHEILQRCRNVGVLATSRVPLGLISEKLYRLDPLSSDGEDSPAVKLFVERTGLDPSADLTSVVGLCQDLDGLPLAIELAATRAHLVSPTEMQERLRDSVAVVSSRDPTLPDRQRSLGRLLDWTIDILSPDERTTLTRLSVIGGGFDGLLAEAVIADDSLGVDEVPELVWSLVDWSLIRRDVTSGSTRYSMLSTVRTHVLQRANEDDVVASRRRLADALLDRVGPQRTLKRALITELGIELENVRGVVGHIDVPDKVARPLAWSIGQYHDVKGLHRTGIAEIGRCIEQRPEPGPDLVALLTLQADLHLRLGETTDAERITARAEAVAAEVGSAEWDDMGLARTKGELALRSDDPSNAARLADTALRTGLATPRGRARLWNLAAIAQYVLGDIEASCAALDECLIAEEEAGLDTFLATTHGNYAEGLLQLGDPVGAAGHQLAALEFARSMGQAKNIAFSCMLAARFAAGGGADDEAVRLQTGADRILDKEGVFLYERDAEQRTTLLETARRALGVVEYEKAVTVGQSIPIDQLADQTAEILQRTAAPMKLQPEDEP
jgi:predicted ATPase/class 3 adenylate cyclase